MIVQILAGALVVAGLSSMVKGSNISATEPDDGLHYRDSDPVARGAGHLLIVLGTVTAVFGLLLLVGGVGL